MALTATRMPLEDVYHRDHMPWVLAGATTTLKVTWRAVYGTV